MHRVMSLGPLGSLFLSLCLLWLSMVHGKTSKGGSRVVGVPAAEGPNGQGYFEKFELDYGTKDNKRIAGAMRGFLPHESLSNLPESDPFCKWWNKYLEEGPSEDLKGRLKPFYAADFGSKEELGKGENPKIIVVQRKVSADGQGFLTNAPKEVDVEVREVWQPWLKSKCKFAVRYIVPNRVNIMKIMESQGRMYGELVIDDADDGNKGKSSKESNPVAVAKLAFKPSWAKRLKGGKTIVIKRKLDYKKLMAGPSNKKRKAAKDKAGAGPDGM